MLLKASKDFILRDEEHATIFGLSDNISPPGGRPIFITIARYSVSLHHIVLHHWVNDVNADN